MILCIPALKKELEIHIGEAEAFAYPILKTKEKIIAMVRRQFLHMYLNISKFLLFCSLKAHIENEIAFI